MHYDVIILGGGPVGLLITCLLKDQGFHVACFDRQAEDSHLTNQRAVALSWGSLNHLDVLHMKEPLLKEGAPINRIWITKENGRSALDYEAHSWGHPMGVNVPMNYLRHLLYDKAKTHLHLNTTLTHLHNNNACWTVETSHHETHTARLLIGADGRTSWLRQQFFKTKQWRYHQVSLVAKIFHTKSHHYQAYEHFLPEGPLALLPLNDNESSLIWTVHPDTAAALMNVTPQVFSAHLTQKFGLALGDLSLSSDTRLVKDTGLVTSYPLGGHYCQQAYKAGVILVGDAAHTMHPVAGQGFNVGLRDAFGLCDHLIHEKGLGLPWWDVLSLKRYYDSRQRDVLSMIGVTHGLVRLFSRDTPLLQSFLSSGLSLVNAIHPLKRFLTKKAMGLS